MTWGLQRLRCHLEQVAQECPYGSRMWGQASPSPFPASWRRPSLPQSAGPFSICGRDGCTQETQEAYGPTGGDSPCEDESQLLCPKLKRLWPWGLPALHLVWLRGPQVPSCSSRTVPPRRQFSALPSLHLTPSWPRVTWITLPSTCPGEPPPSSLIPGWRQGETLTQKAPACPAEEPCLSGVEGTS